MFTSVTIADWTYRPEEHQGFDLDDAVTVIEIIPHHWGWKVSHPKT
jgi:hypothetical protein